MARKTDGEKIDAMTTEVASLEAQLNVQKQRVDSLEARAEKSLDEMGKSLSDHAEKIDVYSDGIEDGNCCY